MSDHLPTPRTREEAINAAWFTLVAGCIVLGIALAIVVDATRE